ncbi:MAG: primosomal protein N', partial [Desulfurivibrio sp.]
MQRDSPLYFEVAVPAPIHHTLTYAPPPGVGRLAPGHRLLVPLGRRQLTGYLLACTTVSPVLKADQKEEAATGGDRRPGKIRAALAVLDPEPLFPAAMVPFFRWVAEYYHHPIGEIIQAALPSGLSRHSVSVIELTPEGAQALADGKREDETPDWLAELLVKGELSPSRSARIIRGRRGVLNRWQKQGWLQITSRLKTEAVRPKTETVVRLLAAAATCSTDLPPPRLKPSEEKTLELVRELTGNSPSGLPRRELIKKYAGAGRALQNLAARGLVQLTEQRLYRDPFGEPPPFFAKPAQLTGEQQEVMEQILPAIATGTYAPFLLHGITGSGKTEIYLRAAEAVLARGRQVLILVPEIALASQLEGHFCSRFGDTVALLHSGLSAGERFDQWSRLLSGAARVAIGARSAIFAPLPDPGLIVVDEEHDPAYKQEDQLRYNARDLALLRGLQQQATVILGSATPAVSSYFQAQKGKFRLLTMEKRIEDRPLPTVEIIDLKEVKTVSGHPPLFSPQLVRALKENLAAGHQSLVFLNRRGFASLMLCKDCGRPVQCEHCQVSLTLHKQRGQL